MLRNISYNQVTLRDNELLRRRDANWDYMLSLRNDHLLLNHALEAGISTGFGDFDHTKIHGGWESPVCQVRGHFVGHWLSAAAKRYAATGEAVIKARADDIVDKLAFYQAENGGRWACSIPEKYMDWIAKGKRIWAPQYTIHKTLMGLVDMYILAGSQKALDVAMNLAHWFYDWTEQFSREQLDDILDVETGGMLEIWAELYGITKEGFCKELMERYYRSRLFDPLLAGKDVLTNMHANTTIPEALGAARAYEVTGDRKWMDIAVAYWDCAVTRRGMYATGGQTCGEIWSPPNALSSRLGDKNQEHCTVYNMMRLAEFLLRHTGEGQYADYWERNLYNGVMAQTYWQGTFTHGIKSEYPCTGLIAYFLPLRAGARKGWGSERGDFFCCHGTLVQANADFTGGIYYQDESSIAICQYFASNAQFERNGVKIEIRLFIDQLTGGRNRSSVQEYVQAVNETSAAIPHNPGIIAVDMDVECEIESEFTLRLRMPWWAKGYTLCIDGEALVDPEISKGFLEITRIWKNNTLRLEMKKELVSYPLPDAPDVVAFMDGPVVLAGLCDEERILYGDKDNPTDILIPDNEREWGMWQNTYRTKNQDRGIRFVPLHKVGYEAYTVYFPIQPKE